MNSVFGLYGIIWTQLIADGITLIISFALYINIYKKLKEQEKNP
jgi:hypothetical protein